MRVTYKYDVRTVSGRMGNVVHTCHNKGRVAIAREYVKPKMMSQNYVYGEIKANIAAIWKECSQEFKNDLKIYTAKRITSYSGDEIPAYANYSHFVRFLYKYSAENPQFDLILVTKKDLEAAGCPDNVADIIQQGYLPPVANADELINQW